MKENEIWTPLKNFEGFYEISTYGRIKTVERIIYTNNNGYIKQNSFIKKQQKHYRGYLTVSLKKNGKIYKKYVHRLVAETFIPNPNNLPQINHKDENKKNNCVDNLEWCDNIYNMNYGSRLKQLSESLKGNIPHNAIKVLFNGVIYNSIIEASKTNNISPYMVKKICNKQNNNKYRIL